MTTGPGSSYSAMTGNDIAPEWLEVDWIVSHFSKQRKKAREKYTDFVRGGIGLSSIWGDLQNQVFLGSECFFNKKLKKIKVKDSLEDIPSLQKRSVPKSIQYYQKKYKDQERAITEACLSGGYTLKQIGEFYGKHYTAISRIVKQNEMRYGTT